MGKARVDVVSGSEDVQLLSELMWATEAASTYVTLRLLSATVHIHVHLTNGVKRKTLQGITP